MVSRPLEGASVQVSQYLDLDILGMGQLDEEEVYLIFMGQLDEEDFVQGSRSKWKNQN